MPECTSCGAFVTRAFARVYGDDNDVPHACLECATREELKNDAAAGFAPDDRRLKNGRTIYTNASYSQ
jgi:hypothetical protein